MFTKIIKGIFKDDLYPDNHMNGKPCIVVVMENHAKKTHMVHYVVEGDEQSPWPWTHHHEGSWGDKLKIHDDFEVIFSPLESQRYGATELIEAPQNNFDGLMGSFATHFASFGIKSLNIDFK